MSEYRRRRVMGDELIEIPTHELERRRAIVAEKMGVPVASVPDSAAKYLSFEPLTPQDIERAREIAEQVTHDCG